jgi:hypothetical protein
MHGKTQDKIKKTNLKRYNSIYFAGTSEMYKGSSWKPTQYIKTWEDYNKLKKDSSKCLELMLQYLSDIGKEKATREEFCTNVFGTSAHSASGWFVSYNPTYGSLIKSSKREEQDEVVLYATSICDSKIITEARPEFMNGLELDIYIPDYNFAIEFNGSYWHSDKYKKRGYHSGKTELARKAGVTIMHIWEYDWNDPVKQDILKSQIAYKLHSSKVKRYYARKLELKQVDKEEANRFYDINHIQGKSNNTLNYGLYHEDELIACMGFNRKQFSRKEDNIKELIRFATKKYTSVSGGASKLFKYYLKEHPDVNTVVSFSNDDFAFDSDKSVYTQLGFTREDKLSVDRYKWVKGDVVVQRYTVQTPKLLAYTLNKRPAPFYGASKDFMKGVDTERSYMERNGFKRVWNSSTGKYVYNR